MLIPNIYMLRDNGKFRHNEIRRKFKTKFVRRFIALTQFSRNQRLKSRPEMEFQNSKWHSKEHFPSINRISKRFSVLFDTIDFLLRLIPQYVSGCYFYNR